jgi:predicted metal-dependent hydrolase
MAALVIGRTTIDYTVRRAPRAHRRRIEVTPQRVVVIVPTTAPDSGAGSAAEFITARRAWVFNAVADCSAAATRCEPQRYASGAKIPYRGRLVLLEIRTAESLTPSVVYRSRIVVTIPAGQKEGERESSIRDALRAWMDDGLRRDALRWASRYAERLKVTAPAVRIGADASAWAICGKAGKISLHRDLSAAPAGAITYVLAHEVAHLVERNHSPRFWKLVAQAEPDWQRLRDSFDRWTAERPRRVM